MLFSVNSASKGSDLERPNMEIPTTCFWSCGVVCLSLACSFFFLTTCFNCCVVGATMEPLSSLAVISDTVSKGEKNDTKNHLATAHL